VYRWTGGEDTTITFDLVLAEDKIVERAVLFGFTGQVPSSFYPFVLLADGRIDFGSDYADDEIRFIQTDLRERPVRLGEVMTTQEKGEDGRFTGWTYRCIRLDAV
jgi:hypothetical protein